MKAVLISIKPEWCELIASGDKTIEARKNFPVIKTPFKCFIYETKGKTATPMFIDEEGHEIYQGRGRIIGEFVCNLVCYILAHPSIFAHHDLFYDKAMKAACLTLSEVEKYSNGKDVYGWQISDLIIYDQPKELSEFGLKRPPQSWQYVEI